MNVTLSMPDSLVEKARGLAARRGTTLDRLVCELLESETAELEALAELEQFWAVAKGNSGGQSWLSREELHARHRR